MYVAVDPEGM